MLLTNIVQLFNTQLAGEQLQIDEALAFLDKTIDAINSELNTCFPVFSEFNITSFPNYKSEEYTTEDEEGNTVIDTAKRAEVYRNYDLFPDEYIRSVVIPGATFRWFSMDEEGTYAAPLFEKEFTDNLFKMVRDYTDLVPYIYKSEKTGSLTDNLPEINFTKTGDFFGLE